MPDVLVLRGDSSAVDCGTDWFGGPNLAIEVVSPGERVLDKLEFYARVGTNELLIINRQRWKLTLYRRRSGTKMDQIAEFSRDNPVVFQGEVVSIRFSIDFDRQLLRLESGDGAKLLEITISS